MKKLFLSLLCFVCLNSVASDLGFAKSSKRAPEGTPTRAIQDLDDILGEYRLNASTPEDRAFNEGLKKRVLTGTVDIRELCKRAMDRHWKERSTSEQDEFVDIMTRLLTGKAIFASEQGIQGTEKGKGQYYVTYEGDQYLNEGKTKVLTKTLVHIKREDLKVALNYKLLKVGDKGWKIYDIIVDGASLLSNYKYQFDQIVKKDGYEDLMRRMKSKLAELEGAGKEE